MGEYIRNDWLYMRQKVVGRHDNQWYIAWAVRGGRRSHYLLLMKLVVVRNVVLQNNVLQHEDQNKKKKKNHKLSISLLFFSPSNFSNSSFISYTYLSHSLYFYTTIHNLMTTVIAIVDNTFVPLHSPLVTDGLSS